MAKKKPNIKAGLKTMMDIANEGSKGRAYIAKDVAKNYRYVDFCDVTLNRPCLPLEYVYGTRGLMTGKVVKYEAMEADGKSSAIFMNYGMAQRAGGAYTVHFESEDAPPPPDFMHHLGCDPDEVLIEHPADVTSCLARITTWLQKIRTSLDKDKVYPLLIGIDSISGLAGKDTSDLSKKAEGGEGISMHARAFSAWFRDYMKHFSMQDAIMMVSGQLKDNINTDKFNQHDNKKMVTLADKPFAFYSTWIMNLYHSKYWVDGEGQLGDIITMKCTKNKQGAPLRSTKVVLMRPERMPNGEPGWDWDMGNKELLFANKSSRMMAFPNNEATSGGGWYKHKGINDNKNYRWDDFIQELYAREDILMEIRNNLRVRGFGLPFEVDYRLKNDDIPDASDT